ncbi:hypothetical protein QN277_011101 [Acacia crassicarpa]|uniref:SKP1-like protein n=1 Tax=Acacia crassicarpa TaxID=499986 RepID=A0AAE1TB46_9FABA|nr:hypothetical protein QN277_011101 [Acacia crassicarpa]
MTSSVKMVTLISGDGGVFEISVKAVAQSNLVQNLLDDVGVSGKFPLNIVNSTMLAKVTEYCQKHANREATVQDGGTEKELKKWDAKFLKMDNDMLFAIVFAAHDMGIKSLFDLSCHAVANMLRSKTPEQIQQVFANKRFS